MIERIEIPPAMQEQIESHALREYPSECCGMIFAPNGSDQLSRVRACTNAQDKYHQLDPESFPRKANTAYYIEPLELLRIDKELRENDERIAVIYHSHPDVDAYFSEEDIRRAAPEGSPIYPGTAYLVISVIKGEIKNRKTFYWDSENQTFVE